MHADQFNGFPTSLIISGMTFPLFAFLPFYRRVLERKYWEAGTGGKGRRITLTVYQLLHSERRIGGKMLGFGVSFLILFPYSVDIHKGFHYTVLSGSRFSQHCRAYKILGVAFGKG